jgi:hypothetical protein
VSLVEAESEGPSDAAPVATSDGQPLLSVMSRPRAVSPARAKRMAAAAAAAAAGAGDRQTTTAPAQYQRCVV